MNKINLVMLGITTGLLNFGNFYISASRASPLTGNCPPEYCKTYASEPDCLCVYNKSDKCYCELYSGGGINCHLSCTAPDTLPKRFIITVWIITICFLITICYKIIQYIIRTIKTRKLFGEAGEKKRYAVIPIRNSYIKSKINKKAHKLK